MGGEDKVSRDRDGSEGRAKGEARLFRDAGNLAPRSETFFGAPGGSEDSQFPVIPCVLILAVGPAWGLAGQE